MGSKKLKAIVVKGKNHTSLASPEKVYSLAKSLSRRSFGPATAKYRELGTAANLLAFNRIAALPTRNFQASTFADAPALSAEELAPVREKARKSCAGCTIGCEHIYGFGGGGSVRVEYESLFALGPLCAIGDPEKVLAASHLCDELGLDTISTGGTVAFAMECAERELLEGAPQFGDGDGLLQTISDIAHRRGLGDLLAEGSKRAAEKIGKNTLDFAPQVKGLEIPGGVLVAVEAICLVGEIHLVGPALVVVGPPGTDREPQGHRLESARFVARRWPWAARATPLAPDRQDRGPGECGRGDSLLGSIRG